jgi:ribose 5-phosphate isomerase A
LLAVLQSFKQCPRKRALPFQAAENRKMVDASSMNTDSAVLRKQRAARAALGYLQPDMVLGIGTGTTVNVLIDLLNSEGWAPRLRGAVSSSDASSARLRTLGIPILDLNEVTDLSLYIDGADEATRSRVLIKGGGAALTREKIVAACAARFICIIDSSKLVPTLGGFPLPVEVIPMARRYVMQQLAAFGGRPVWRQGCITDNGNDIVDVHDLSITAPLEAETRLNQITGVVTVGLFAARPADLMIVGTSSGVEVV